MKRLVCMAITLVLAALCLTACGGTGGGSAADKPAASGAAQQEENKVVHGIINRIGNYLVLLTDDGEYQIMDYTDKAILDGFAEGDSVDVTYTGELGVEGSTPVIVSIEKAD